MSALPSPAQIAAALQRRVVGQGEALREMAVALAKKLAGMPVGNILMIGASGSGKTTLMRAVEDLLSANPQLAARSTVVRVHANILGEEAEQGHPGEKLLLRLLARAREQLGLEAPIERLLEQASHGIVFIDEIDKIRSYVGGQANISGIRAQEALLTLIENEAVPFRLPEWAGGKVVAVNSNQLLFICAGAFEGLYDSVYHRVTAGKDKGVLRPITVVEDGRVREELQFSLREWLKSEDLFEYGITPQFLSRFDAVVRQARSRAGRGSTYRARGRAPATPGRARLEGGLPPRDRAVRVRAARCRRRRWPAIDRHAADRGRARAPSYTRRGRRDDERLGRGGPGRRGGGVNGRAHSAGPGRRDRAVGTGLAQLSRQAHTARGRAGHLSQPHAYIRCGARVARGARRGFSERA
ncbi:MAG: AAA family ATPase [Vicinamibacteria bacterium]|nr:AAA family ATPase [Vicinamibacteria bacterium]